MKTRTLFLMLVILSGVIAFSGCKKYVEQGANNNIIENSTVTVSPSQWSHDNTNDRFYYRYSVTTNANSVVVAYVSGSSGNQALPYYISTSSVYEYYGLATSFISSPQYIELQYKNIFSPNTAPTADKIFYINIIPPGEYAAHPGLDWTDYAAVKEELNLPY